MKYEDIKDQIIDEETTLVEASIDGGCWDEYDKVVTLENGKKVRFSCQGIQSADIFDNYEFVEVV